MKRKHKILAILILSVFLVLSLCGCARASVEFNRKGTGSVTITVAKEDGVSFDDINARIGSVLDGISSASGESGRVTFKKTSETEDAYVLKFTFKDINKTKGAGNYIFSEASAFFADRNRQNTFRNFSNGKIARSIEKYDQSIYKLNDTGVSIHPIDVATGEQLDPDVLAERYSAKNDYTVFVFAIPDIPEISDIDFSFPGTVEVISDAGVKTLTEKSIRVYPVDMKASVVGIDASGDSFAETDVNKQCFAGYVVFKNAPNVWLIASLSVLSAFLVGGIVFGIASGGFKRGIRAMKQSKKIKLFVHNYSLYIMIIPASALFLVFCYAPMAGLVVAFKNYTVEGGIFGSEWVGFKHFINAFTNKGSGFWGLLRNTVGIASLKFIFGFPASIILALMFNRLANGFFKKTVQTISYLPYFVSWIVLSGMCYLLLATDGGIINNLLIKLNASPVKFYDTPKYWWGILTASSIWKNVGWGTIVYLAALTSIDTDLYEAADIDGARAWDKLWHVTLPGMMPVIGIQLILNMGSLIKDDFDQIYAMVGGDNYALRGVTEVFSSLIFRQLQSGPAGYSPSTAIGLIQSVISLILVLVANSIVRKTDNPGLW